MQNNVPKILACRYVSDELMAKLLAEAQSTTSQTLPTLDVYPGSVKRPCFKCGEAVWVGPRQQTVLEADKAVLTACMPCALIAASVSFEQFGVAQLGNPYRSATETTSPRRASERLP